VTSYLALDARLIRSLVRVPIPDDTDALFLTYAVLLRAKGSDVTAADVHDAWVAWMQQHDPTHPALVPFDLLDAATQAQDEPYVEAIRAAAVAKRS
jgi:hypothetical protein